MSKFFVLMIVSLVMSPIALADESGLRAYVCCGESDYAVIDAAADMNKCLNEYSQKHKVVGVSKPVVAFGNKDYGKNAIAAMCVSITSQD